MAHKPPDAYTVRAFRGPIRGEGSGGNIHAGTYPEGERNEPNRQYGTDSVIFGGSMITGVGVIDIWCNLFTESGIREFGSSPFIEEARREWDIPDLFADGTGKTPEEFVTYMDEHSIDQVFIPSLTLLDEYGGAVVDIPHEEVADVCRSHPERFKGLVGIDARDVMSGIINLETYVTEHGFVGAVLEPHGYGASPDHNRFYPFYAKCAELDVPVVIVTGHLIQALDSRYGRPVYLDQVAIDFPELNIVAAHTGWPWVKELVAVSMGNANVYISTSAHAPQFWEDDLVEFMRTMGREKVLFGSDYQLVDPGVAIDQIKQMDLDGETRRALVCDNAVRVFDL
jgi:predicted TIM-barrel fold metal-dependent hydrolase